jgi:Ras-related protein Rab-4B
VPLEHAQTWASTHKISHLVEVSAYSGEQVDELFERLARIILTRIELGEIDPDDPASGIQYGDGGWGWDEAGSVKSGVSGRSWGDGRVRSGGAGTGRRRGIMGEWEDVFKIGRRRRAGGGCCS